MNQVAIVTGGTSGLGLAAAEQHDGSQNKSGRKVAGVSVQHSRTVGIKRRYDHR